MFDLGTGANQLPGSVDAIPVGSSKTGGEFDVSLTTADIVVEESLDPLKVVATGRKSGFKLEMAEINTSNWAFAVNQAQSAWVGTPGAATVAHLDPPSVGAETRYQLLYVNNDQDFIVIGWQVLQVGNIAEKFQKGANYSTLMADWNFELPPTSVGPQPWRVYVTGTDWLATLYSE